MTPKSYRTIASLEREIRRLREENEKLRREAARAQSDYRFAVDMIAKQARTRSSDGNRKAEQ